MSDRWLVIHPDATIRKAESADEAIRLLHPSGCSRIVKFSEVPGDGSATEGPGRGHPRRPDRVHLRSIQ